MILANWNIIRNLIICHWKWASVDACVKCLKFEAMLYLLATVITFWYCFQFCNIVTEPVRCCDVMHDLYFKPSFLVFTRWYMIVQFLILYIVWSVAIKKDVSFFSVATISLGSEIFLTQGLLCSTLFFNQAGVCEVVP